MSLNPNVRTKRIEMMANAAEVALLDATRGPVDRSSFLRGLMHNAARMHRMPPAPPKESRGCRGARPASRASVGVAMRRQV